MYESTETQIVVTRLIRMLPQLTKLTNEVINLTVSSLDNVDNHLIQIDTTVLKAS